MTAFLSHILIMLTCLFLLPVLQYIPLAVFYGLFLSMAASGVQGNQFFERVLLFFTQVAHYPPSHVIRRVPLKIVHGYTAIQLLMLIVLWVVKSTIIGLSFPLFLLATIPLRSKILPRFIDSSYLDRLDASEQ